MKNYNEIYGQLCTRLMTDRENTVFEMTQNAARELFKAVQKDYYDWTCLRDLNYSEICDWLDWPDLQDGGIFEQTIDNAANMVLGVLGYKPLHGTPEYKPLHHGLLDCPK